MLSVVVPDKLVPMVVKTLIEHKPDRQPGDGKVFVMPVREAMRVRTGEHGDTALDETID